MESKNVIAEKAEEISDTDDKWLEGFTRFGFIGKGVVYTLTGIFAALTALELDDKTKGSKEILLAILQQPFGQILIVILAAGLFGYAAWKFINAVKNPEDDKIPARIFNFLIGIFYSGFGIYALVMAFDGDENSAGDSETQRHLTGAILSNDLGQIAVGLIGFGFIGAGFYQIYKGLTDEFRECLREHQMSDWMQTVAVVSGRVGLTARGIVFILIGIFLNFAAYNARQKTIVGISGALDIVAKQSYGDILVAIAAAGLILYGINMFITARYRRMNLD